MIISIRQIHLAWDHGLARAVLGVAARAQLPASPRAPIRAPQSAVGMRDHHPENIHFHTLLFEGMVYAIRAILATVAGVAIARGPSAPFAASLDTSHAAAISA